MENTNVTEQSTNEIMPMAARGETNFASLPEKTTPASGDMFLMEDSEDTKKINYDKLADAILNKLTSKTYSGLETTAKNFVTAINELNSKFKYDYYYSGKTYNLDDMYIQNPEIAENIFMYLRNLDSGVNTGSSLPIKATCAIILGDMQVIFGFQTPVYYRYMWGDWSEWKTI